jgi:hypothetical protein
MPAPASLVRRDGPLMYGAIFLMAAPIGVLLAMVQDQPQGWVTALVCAALTGAISCAWAYAFIRERWWVLVPANIAPFVGSSVIVNVLVRSGLIGWGMGLSPRARLVVLAAMCVLFTAAGFVLFVVHLRRTEQVSAGALAEMEVARRVHATLVPPITLSTAAAEVYGRSTPSSTMGGDLIDVVSEGKNLDVLLGDVSGHGVGAGVVMAMLKGCVRTRLLHGADLAEVVTDANRVLASLTGPGTFATFVALRLRPDRVLEFALAGHLPVFHYRAQEGRWERYPNQSLPLGVEEQEQFVAGSASVSTGDIIAVFTDGLMEVQERGGRELGMEGVAAILRRSVSPALPAMHDAVFAAVGAHGPQLDDQSLVLILIK